LNTKGTEKDSQKAVYTLSSGGKVECKRLGFRSHSTIPGWIP